MYYAMHYTNGELVSLFSCRRQSLFGVSIKVLPLMSWYSWICRQEIITFHITRNGTKASVHEMEAQCNVNGKLIYYEYTPILCAMVCLQSGQSVSASWVEQSSQRQRCRHGSRTTHFSLYIHTRIHTYIKRK